MKDYLDIFLKVLSGIAGVVIAIVTAHYGNRKPLKTKAEDMKSEAEAEKLKAEADKIVTDSEINLAEAALKFATRLQAEVDDLNKRLAAIKKEFEEEVRKRKEVEDDLEKLQAELEILRKMR